MSKSLPPSHCGVGAPSASNSPRVLSAQALRARAPAHELDNDGNKDGNNVSPSVDLRMMINLLIKMNIKIMIKIMFPLLWT